MNQNDTIYALSSGAAPSAIAIIRISGDQAFHAVKKLCDVLPKARHASLRRLKASDGTILDEALIILFPGPNSATGEDLAELHLHGGRAVVRAVEAELATMQGLRQASAGEYTRRSFENGVMDLNQADGLSDLLFAETERQRKAAISMMGGAFGAKISQWQDIILFISAMIESELDFSDEDDVDSGQQARLIQQADALRQDVEMLLNAPSVEALRDGIKVALCGPPNSGKSTLLNALVGRDAAIVSDIAGTTRDIIEIPIALNGVAFVFLDTAGLRDSEDDIEIIGIERARLAFDNADIIMWLGDDVPPPHDETQKLLWLAPKCDITEHADDNRISISAITGEGLIALKEALIDHASDLIPSEDGFALNKRQREQLRHISGAMFDMTQSDDWLIMGEHARLARAAIDRLTGKAHTEELLDNIFGRFCIGK